MFRQSCHMLKKIHPGKLSIRNQHIAKIIYDCLPTLTSPYSHNLLEPSHLIIFFCLLYCLYFSLCKQIYYAHKNLLNFSIHPSIQLVLLNQQRVCNCTDKQCQTTKYTPYIQNIHAMKLNQIWITIFSRSFT